MVPALLIERLYTVGSLHNTDAGVRFAIKNRLTDAELTAVRDIAIDGCPLDMDRVRLHLEDGRTLSPGAITGAQPHPFPSGCSVTIETGLSSLEQGRHRIEIGFVTRPFGELRLTVEDRLAEAAGLHIPRSETDDYDEEMIRRRRQLLEQHRGVRLEHVTRQSFDPHRAKGNCENFVGIAQVPIGLAGPLRICGESANGEYLIPLATTEGTLVASHNRGMKVLNLSGGVKTTVMADAMQRAPAFVLRDARACRDFVQWVEAHAEQIRHEAEATSTVAKLQYIDPYVA